MSTDGSGSNPLEVPQPQGGNGGHEQSRVGGRIEQFLSPISSVRCSIWLDRQAASLFAALRPAAQATSRKFSRTYHAGRVSAGAKVTTVSSSVTQCYRQSQRLQASLLPSSGVTRSIATRCFRGCTTCGRCEPSEGPHVRTSLRMELVRATCFHGQPGLSQDHIQSPVSLAFVQSVRFGDRFWLIEKDSPPACPSLA